MKRLSTTPPFSGKSSITTDAPLIWVNQLRRSFHPTSPASLLAHRHSAALQREPGPRGRSFAPRGPATRQRSSTRGANWFPAHCREHLDATGPQGWGRAGGAETDHRGAAAPRLRPVPSRPVAGLNTTPHPGVAPTAEPAFPLPYPMRFRPRLGSPAQPSTCTSSLRSSSIKTAIG